MTAAPTRRIYLDNNATTRPDPAVVAAMLPYLSEHFGNPSSSHAGGEAPAEAVRESRRQVQALLGAASAQEIIFTSGGTESNMTALTSALNAQAGRDEMVISAVEHAAVLRPALLMGKSRNIGVHVVGVDASGRLDIDAYTEAVSSRTALVSIMTANNETGTLFPIADLAKIAKRHGALFHTDAVQAAGKIALNVRETDIDLMSVSSHKLHGPKGVGALYVRKAMHFTPLIPGGQQERGRRGGTENVPGIAGFGAAAALAMQRLAQDKGEIPALRDALQAGLLALGGCRVNGDMHHRLPNTLHIAFENLDGEALLLQMSQAGVAASSGAACSSGGVEPSHVLRAMKLPVTALHGALRFSLSHETTHQDVAQALERIAGIVARLRCRAPHIRETPGHEAISLMGAA